MPETNSIAQFIQVDLYLDRKWTRYHEIIYNFFHVSDFQRLTSSSTGSKSQLAVEQWVMLAASSQTRREAL